MHLSARDVINKQFHDQWRGYNQQEVDDFLDRIAESLDAIQRENLTLQTRIRELDQAVSTSRETEEMLKKTLVTAQQAAEKAIATAKEKAENLIAEAEERVKQVNADAEERVQSAQAEVNRRAMDAQRQYDLKKRDLDATIEKLSKYENELKDKLKNFLQQEKAYLEQQIAALDTLSTNGRPVPAASPAATQSVRREVSPTGASTGPATQHTQPFPAPTSPQAAPSEAARPTTTEATDADNEDSDEQPARRSVRSLFWRDDS